MPHGTVSRVRRGGVRALVRALAPLPLPLSLTLLAPATARAQGVTAAALDGRVVFRGDAATPPADSVHVSVVNASTGLRITPRLQIQNGHGRFSVETLAPGGPYAVSVSAPGYASVQQTGIRLALGQRAAVTIALDAIGSVRLARDTATLRTVAIAAERGPLLSRSRTGPEVTVTDSAIRRLPVLSRDLVELVQLAPQLVGTLAAGASTRANDILVDGAANTDVFALSRGTGAPGGQVGARSIPFDAVREFQVLLAPFDVRHGSFTGAEISAVTRSGTNAFHGTLFGFLQNESLVGTDAAGRRPAHFTSASYGGTLGGPIIRDRLHFFGAAELKGRTTPYAGPLVGVTPNVGISADSATRFIALLRGYGLAPGTTGAYTTRNEGTNVFGKLSAPTGRSGQAEWSVNYAKGEVTDTLAPPRVAGGDYRLTSAGFAPASTQWSTRLRWTTLVGSRTNNELLASVLRVDEPRDPNSTAPGIFVGGVGAAGARLIGGGDPSSQQLALRQRAVELTDNATVALGPHLVTAGVHGEFYGFRFASVPNAVGQWQFTSLAALQAGTASRFIRTIALRPGGLASDFDANQAGAYLQDLWQATDRVAITAGVRVDVPWYPTRAVRNDALAASPIGVNTSEFIRTRALLAPRLGINWAVRDGTTLRGGAGVFTGRVPGSFVSFAYLNTGRDAAVVSCGGGAVPAFVADPARQPSACASGSVAPTSQVSYFPGDFRIPQVIKASLGVDQRLGHAVVGSLDALVDRGQHSLYITDQNLGAPVGALAGEGGRMLYGRIATTSSRGALPAVTPNTVSASVGPVLRNGSRSGDRAVSLTAQVAKRFGAGPLPGAELAAAYSYTDAEDYFSLRDAQTVSNYGFAPLDGSLADRRLTTSSYSIPHKVTVSGTTNLPFGVALSAIYIGRSGLPFTYVVNGDANADGVGNRVGSFDRQQNDVVYVPRDRNDVALVRDIATPNAGNILAAASPSAYDSLEAFIASEPCLRDHRGQLLERNSCRNPWQNLLNARLATTIRAPGRQSMQVTLDVFNVLNLVDRDWGLVRETGTFASAGTENVPLLRLRGQDATTGRNLYDLAFPARRVVNVDASRWALQLGARYAF
jgi:hypothetical protein